MSNMEVPEITAALKKEAKNNPNGWVYHIDTIYSSNQHVPPEAIVGAWEVDGNGELTGIFRHNDKYKKKN